MGLAVRIIPTLLTRGRTLVKGVAFDSWRSVGMAHQAVRIHSMRGVDEMVICDISATAEQRGPDLNLIAELADTCFMPVSVGGGIRTVNQVDALLRAGADKVIIGSAAIEEPDLIQKCADRFGSQAIVVSIDYRLKSVAIRCGTKPIMQRPEFIAMVMEQRGAGEIMLTNITLEGAMGGYDLETIANTTSAVGIPVIAHAGCGTYHHMLEAIQAGANAVAAGSMFQFTDQTPRGAAEYLKQHNIEVRL